MSDKRTITVTLTFDVEVDAEAWAAEYDVEPTPSTVRADVRNYFRHIDMGVHDFIPTHLENIVWHI